MYNIKTYTNKLKTIDATYLQITATTKNKEPLSHGDLNPAPLSAPANRLRFSQRV